MIYMKKEFIFLDEVLCGVRWDGYRPQRAVDCFLHWSTQPEDGRTKEKHYPNIE